MASTNNDMRKNLTPEDMAEINRSKLIQNREDEVYCAQLEEELQSLRGKTFEAYQFNDISLKSSQRLKELGRNVDLKIENGVYAADLE